MPEISILDEIAREAWAPEFDTKSPFEAISGVGLVMNQ